MQFGHYGFIPADLRHHKEITANAKVLYSEISATMENGVCLKNNAYFSRVLNIHKSTITKCLGELRENLYITITIENEEGTQKFLKRYIYFTPTGFQAQGKDISTLPPTWNFDGVGSSNDYKVRNTGKTPNGNQSSILFNNNIRYITSNKDKTVSIDKNLNQDQKNYLLGIVDMFYSMQSKRYPEVINQNWKTDTDLINKSVNTLYMLIKIDCIDYSKMKNVLVWALDDKFWCDKILSINALRQRASNGLSKFTNILHSYNMGQG